VAAESGAITETPHDYPARPHFTNVVNKMLTMLTDLKGFGWDLAANAVQCPLATENGPAYISALR
jgi:hypothetical protein